MRILIVLLALLFSSTVLAQENPYRIIAYYTGNDTLIRQYPLARVSHVIYSFLKLQNDTLTFHNDRQRRIVEGLIRLKEQYPQLKIMVSVGGWGGCSPCSDLFASEDHRKTFAHTVVALFKQYHIDGLDLDWEYPAIEGYPGHKFSPGDKDNFTSLVKTLREEMGNDYILSFAAGGFTDYLANSID